MVVNMLHYSGYISSYTFVRKRGEVAIRALYFIFSSFCQLSMSSGNTSSTIVSSDTQQEALVELNLHSSSNDDRLLRQEDFFFLGGSQKKVL